MTVRDLELMGVVMKFATFGRIAVTALLIAASVGVASAADMPVKAPSAAPRRRSIGTASISAPMPVPPGWTRRPHRIRAVSPLPLVPQTAPVPITAFPPRYDMGSSFIGGGTVGYNWQPTPYTLIGLENDFGYLHLKGSIIQNPPPLGSNDTVATTKLGDWYDAYTARIGAVDGHAMFYVKGGGVSVKYATGVVDTNAAGTTINTTTTKTLSGWAAGGGVEYGMDMHWSVKAEYLVLGVARNVNNCGTAFLFGVTPLATLCSTTHTPDVQMITVGLNYRFR